MNHYSDFNSYVIKERNEGIRREVRALRLEGHLRQDQRQAREHADLPSGSTPDGAG